MKHLLIGLLLLFTLTSGLFACESVSFVTQPVEFGVYNPLSSQPKDVTGTVEILCIAVPGTQVDYTISLSPSSGTPLPERKMTASQDELQYNLYTDPQRIWIWGDGSGGTATSGDSFVLQQPSELRSYPIYARLPAFQPVRPDIYTDQIVVTVSF